MTRGVMAPAIVAAVTDALRRRARELEPEPFIAVVDFAAELIGVDARSLYADLVRDPVERDVSAMFMTSADLGDDPTDEDTSPFLDFASWNAEEPSREG